MRTATDLDTAHRTWGGALLVVGFPKMTRVVRSGFPDRLRVLEAALRRGGIPAGVVTIQENTDGTREYFYGVFYLAMAPK